jgi:hypothetical protein
MPLPPKGDPRRPMHLAIRSMRLLGIVLLCFGGCVGLAFGVAVGSAAGGFGGGGGGAGAAWGVWFVLVLAGGMFILPGVLYLVAAGALKRRRQWAIVLGLVLSGLKCMLWLIGTVSAAVGLASSMIAGNGPSLGRVGVQLLIGLGFTAAFGQLIWHLSQSFAGLRLADDAEPRGFEPILPYASPAAPAPRPPPIEPIEPREHI